MRRFIGFALLSALIVAPLFARPSFGSKSTTVDISQGVTAGSTRIPSGEYKVAYTGDGPDVKVSLAKDGSSPIILDAKFVPGKRDQVSVTVRIVNGVRVLRQIDLKNGVLVFETSDPVNQ